MARKEPKTPSTKNRDEWKRRFREVGTFARESAKLAFSDMAPNTSTTVTTTSQLMRDTNDFISKTRNRVHYQARQLHRNLAGRRATEILNSAYKDIQSGSFSLSSLAGDSFDVSDDFDSSIGKIDMEIDSARDDPQAAALAESKKNSALIGKVVAQGNAATIEGMEQMTKTLTSVQMKLSQSQEAKSTNLAFAQMNQMNAGFASVRSSLNQINGNLANLLDFQRQHVQAVDARTAEFQSLTSGMMEEMGAGIAEMRDIMQFQRQQMEAAAQLETEKKDRAKFDFSSGFDANEYIEMVKKNYKTSSIGMTGSMVGMTMSMLPMLLMGTDPKHLLGSMGIKALIPKSVKSSIGRADTMLSQTIENLLYRVGELAGNANPALDAIGSIFGKRRENLSGPKMADFKRDAMSWNGLAQKTLTEVIPGYLARIEQSVVNIGKAPNERVEERFFNMDTGMFETRSHAERQLTRQINAISASNTVDLKSEIQKSIARTERGNQREFQAIKLLCDGYIRDVSRAKLSGERQEKLTVLSNQLWNSLLAYVGDGLLTISDITDIHRQTIRAGQNIVDQMMDSTRLTSSQRHLFNEESTYKKNTARIYGDAQRKFEPLSSSDYYNCDIDKYWSEMSESEKKKFRDKYEDYKKLNTEDFETIRQNAQWMSSMDSEDDLIQWALSKVPLVNKFKKKKGPFDRESNETIDYATSIAYIYANGLGDPLNLKGKAFGLRSGVQNRLGQRAASSQDTQSRARASQTSSQVTSETSDLMTRMGVDRILNSDERTIANRSKRTSNVIRDTLSSNIVISEGSDANQALIEGIQQAEETNRALMLSLHDNFLAPLSSSLFGKFGIFQKFFSKESMKTIRDQLFDEENGPLGGVTKWMKDRMAEMTHSFDGKGYYDSEGVWHEENKNSIFDHIAKGYDFMYTNTMKYLFGDDYTSDERFQKYFKFLDFRGKRDKKREARIAEHEAALSGKSIEELNSAEIVTEEGSEDQKSIKETLTDTAGKIKEVGLSAVDRMKGQVDALVGPEGKITSDPKKFADSYLKEVSKSIPRTAVGAGAGALVGASSAAFGTGLLGSLFLPGGPIGGAILGAGLSFITRTESFQKFMFGEKDDDGKRMGGLISRHMQDTFKKNLPTIVGSSVVGAISGMAKTSLGLGVVGGPGGFLLNTLLPGGPIGGAILGLGISVVKSSDTFQRVLFGEEGEDGKRHDGILNKANGSIKKVLEKNGAFIKGGLKGIGGGLVTGLTLSKMGILGSAVTATGPVGWALAGLGIGIASQTEKFQELLFGKEDEEGNRDGTGLLTKFRNVLTSEVIEPMRDKFVENTAKLGLYLKTKIEQPLKEIFGPLADTMGDIKQDISDTIHGVFEKVGDTVTKAFKSTMGFFTKPLVNAAKFVGSGMMNAAKFGTRMAMAPVQGALSLGRFATRGLRNKAGQTSLTGHLWDNAGTILTEGIGAAQDVWANDDREYGPGILGGIDRFLTRGRDIYRGISGAKEAAITGYNEGLKTQGRNHFGWMDAARDSKRAKKRFDRIMDDQKQWKKADAGVLKGMRQSANYANQFWSDDAIEKAKDKLSKAGVSDEIVGAIQNSDDMNKILYNRSAFVKSLKEGKGSSSEGMFRQKTLSFQEAVLHKFDSVTKLFARFSIQDEINRTGTLDMAGMHQLEKSLRASGLKISDLDIKKRTKIDLTGASDKQLKKLSEGDFTDENDSTGVNRLLQSMVHELQGIKSTSEATLNLESADISSETGVGDSDILKARSGKWNIVPKSFRKMQARLADKEREKAESEEIRKNSALIPGEEDTSAEAAKALIEDEDGKKTVLGTIGGFFKGIFGSVLGMVTGAGFWAKLGIGTLIAGLFGEKIYKTAETIFDKVSPYVKKGISVAGDFLQEKLPGFVDKLTDHIVQNMSFIVDNIGKVLFSAGSTVAKKAVNGVFRMFGLNEPFKDVSNSKSKTFETESEAQEYAEKNNLNSRGNQVAASDEYYDSEGNLVSVGNAGMTRAVVHGGKDLLVHGGVRKAAKFVVAGTGKAAKIATLPIRGPIGMGIRGVAKGAEMLGHGVIGAADVVSKVGQKAGSKLASSGGFLNIFGRKAATEGAEEVAEEAGKTFVREGMEGIVESEAKAGLKAWVTKARNIVTKMGSKVPQMGNGKWGKFVEGLFKSVDDSIAKMGEKQAQKMAAKVAKEGAEATVESGAKSAGVVGLLLTAGFAVYDAASGAAAASYLFEVSSDNVTPAMRTVASIVNTILGLPYVMFIDIALEIIKMVNGNNPKAMLCKFLYKAIGGDTEQLKLASDELKAECEKYNQQNNTNLTVNQYNELANGKKGIFSRMGNWARRNILHNKEAIAEYNAVKSSDINTNSAEFQQYLNQYTAKNGSGSSTTKSAKIPTTSSGRMKREEEYSAYNNNYSAADDPNRLSNITYNGTEIYNGPGPIGFGYTQNDPRWGAQPIGKFANGQVSTMSTGGCGPTALANVASAVNNSGPTTSINPVSVAKYANSKGYIQNGGATADLFTKGAAEMGMRSHTLNKSTLHTAIKTGAPVVVAGKATGKGSSPYTRAGHILSVRGVDKRGNAIVDDPASGQRSVPTSELTKGMTHGWSYTTNRTIGQGPSVINNYIIRRHPVIGFAGDDTTVTADSATGGSAGTVVNNIYIDTAEELGIDQNTIKLAYKDPAYNPNGTLKTKEQVAQKITRGYQVTAGDYNFNKIDFYVGLKVADLKAMRNLHHTEYVEGGGSKAKGGGATVRPTKVKSLYSSGSSYARANRQQLSNLQPAHLTYGTTTGGRAPTYQKKRDNSTHITYGTTTGGRAAKINNKPKDYSYLKYGTASSTMIGNYVYNQKAIEKYVNRVVSNNNKKKGSSKESNYGPGPIGFAADAREQGGYWTTIGGANVWKQNGNTYSSPEQAMVASGSTSQLKTKKDKAWTTDIYADPTIGMFKMIYDIYVGNNFNDNYLLTLQELNEIFTNINQDFIKKLGGNGMSGEYEFKYGFPFYQTDEENWANIPWRGGKVSERGGDLSALGMVATAFSDNWLTPEYIKTNWIDDTPEWYNDTEGLVKDIVFNNGGYNAMKSAMMNGQRVKVEKANSTSSILKALQAYKPVVMEGVRYKGGPFGGYYDAKNAPTDGPNDTAVVVGRAANDTTMAILNPYSTRDQDDIYPISKLDDRVNGKSAIRKAYIVSGPNGEGLEGPVDLSNKTGGNRDYVDWQNEQGLGKLEGLIHNFAAIVSHMFDAALTGKEYRSIMDLNPIEGEGVDGELNTTDAYADSEIQSDLTATADQAGENAQTTDTKKTTTKTSSTKDTKLRSGTLFIVDGLDKEMKYAKPYNKLSKQQKAVVDEVKDSVPIRKSSYTAAKNIKAIESNSPSKYYYCTTLADQSKGDDLTIVRYDPVETSEIQKSEKVVMDRNQQENKAISAQVQRQQQTTPGSLYTTMNGTNLATNRTNPLSLTAGTTTGGRPLSTAARIRNYSHLNQGRASSTQTGGYRANTSAYLRQAQRVQAQANKNKKKGNLLTRGWNRFRKWVGFGNGPLQDSSMSSMYGPIGGGRKDLAIGFGGGAIGFAKPTAKVAGVNLYGRWVPAGNKGLFWYEDGHYFKNQQSASYWIKRIRSGYKGYTKGGKLVTFNGQFYWNKNGNYFKPIKGETIKSHQKKKSSKQSQLESKGYWTKLGGVDRWRQNGKYYNSPQEAREANGYWTTQGGVKLWRQNGKYYSEQEVKLRQGIVKGTKWEKDSSSDSSSSTDTSSDTSAFTGSTGGETTTTVSADPDQIWKDLSVSKKLAVITTANEAAQTGENYEDAKRKILLSMAGGDTTSTDASATTADAGTTIDGTTSANIGAAVSGGTGVDAIVQKDLKVWPDDKVTAKSLNDWIAAEESYRHISSPMHGQGEALMQGAATTGLDPRYIVADAIGESSMGTKGAGIPYNNFWGYGIPNAHTIKYKWNSPAEALAEYPKLLNENYYHKHKQTSLYLFSNSPDGWHNYNGDKGYPAYIAKFYERAPGGLNASGNMHGEAGSGSSGTAAKLAGKTDSIGNGIGALINAGVFDRPGTNRHVGAIGYGKSWLEIVVAVKKAIADQKPGYNQGKFITIEVDGVKRSVRCDCSGLVSACISYYTGQDYLTNSDGLAAGSNSLLESHGFKAMDWPGWDNLQPGDILARSGHTEIFAGKPAMVYNCGGDSTVNSPNPAKSAKASSSYSRVWRPADAGSAPATSGDTSKSSDTSTSSSSSSSGGYQSPLARVINDASSGFNLQMQKMGLNKLFGDYQGSSTTTTTTTTAATTNTSSNTMNPSGGSNTVSGSLTGGLPVTQFNGSKNMTHAANRNIQYIVMHYTASPSSKAGTAKNVASYFQNQAKASADFIIDDGEIVQYNPDPMNQYTHAIGGAKYPSMSTSLGGVLYGKAKNENQISIEMQSTKGDNDVNNDMASNWSISGAVQSQGAQLASALANSLGLSKDNVITHHMVTGKICPAPWSRNENDLAGWRNFQSKLQIGGAVGMGPGPQITSGYGKRSSSLGNEFHRGIDIAAGYGSQVYSPTSGIVVDQGHDPVGYGNYAVVQDMDGNNHIFGHLSSTAGFVVGDEIFEGEPIGEVGDSGRATGSHLHYEIRKNGNKYSTIDPLRYNKNSASKLFNINKLNTKVTRRVEQTDDAIGSGKKDLHKELNHKIDVALDTKNIEDKMNSMIEIMRTMSTYTEEISKKPTPATSSTTNNNVYYGAGDKKTTVNHLGGARDASQKQTDQSLLQFHRSIAAK